MKKKIGRKTLAIAAVVVVALSFVVSAQLVSYMSNEVTKEVTAESPFELTKSGIPGTIHGGSSVNFDLGVKNLANNDLDATISLKIQCDDGIDDYEMTQLIINEVVDIKTGNKPIAGYWSWGSDYKIVDLLADPPITETNVPWSDNDVVYNRINDWKYEYQIPLGIIPAETGYTITSTITLDPCALGTYTLTAQII